MSLVPHPSVKHGYSLIETMVVVAILGVMAAIAVPDLTPLLQKVKQNAAAGEAIQFVDRARRMAVNEGRCYRVRLDGDALVIERRSHGDCVNVGGSADTGWDAAVATLRPSAPGIGFAIATLDTAPGSVLIFRPSGRLRGDGDLRVSDDGARLVVSSAALPNRKLVLLVTAAGRTCVQPVQGALPALAAPVVCGTGFTGVSGGTSGGGCAAVQSTSANLPALFGLFGWGLFNRRRRRPGSQIKPRRRVRGYLMIEVVAASGVLAILLGTTLSVIAAARRDVTHYSRVPSAVFLAKAKADELLSNPHGIVAAGSDTVDGFARRWRVENPNLQSKSDPPLVHAEAVLDVVVEVDTTLDGSTRTYTYRTLRRRQ